jgi:hypothetical protein
VTGVFALDPEEPVFQDYLALDGLCDPMSTEVSGPIRGGVRVLADIQNEGGRTHVEPVPRAFLRDINADGLADLVVSVRLRGPHIDVDCDGDLLPTPWEQVGGTEGITKSIVFRNTGTGWVRDENDPLAQGLPPFEEVAFESEFYTERQSPRSEEELIGHAGEGSCPWRGLAQSPTNNVCYNLIDFDPRFIDLNADGYLDLLVLEREEPGRLWVCGICPPLGRPVGDERRAQPGLGPGSRVDGGAALGARASLRPPRAEPLGPLVDRDAVGRNPRS